MATLRDIAAQRGLNVDWNRLNSTQGGGDTAYRQSIFAQLGDQYNPYGTLGANGIDFSGDGSAGIPDDLRGTRWEGMGQRLGATDGASLRGMLARGRGTDLYQGDRGNYNTYVADVGSLRYDPEAGWLPGEGGFQEGDRVGQSFSNMRVWGPAAVLAIGGGMNALGAQSGGSGAGIGGGGGGSGGGLLGGTSPLPPLEGAPALGGGSAASQAAANALPGLNAAGINVGTQGAMIPGMSPGLLGAGNAAGSFDSGGWSGTGINGNTGTRGLLGQMQYNVTGMLNNPVGWAMNNPVTALRGASSLYQLGSAIVGPRGNDNQGSGPQSSKGGGQPGQSVNVPPPTYYQNQNTLSQLAQLYGGR